MRAKVVAECTLKESAAINQILGRRVRFLFFFCYFLTGQSFTMLFRLKNFFLFLIFFRSLVLEFVMCDSVAFPHFFIFKLKY